MPRGLRLPRALAAILAGAALALASRAASSDPIYVATSGSDFSPGTQAAPVRTIEHGITLAAGGGQPVYIGEGLYSETVQLASGVSLYGGFVPTDGWSRDPAGHPTTIAGGTTAVIGDGDNTIALDGLIIHSSDADPAASSIGVFLKSCVHVSVLNCRVEAGNGGAGVAGSAGTAGGGGNVGLQGKPGCENSAALFCKTCPQPLGGNGGTSSFGSAGGKGGDAGVATAAGSNGASGSGSSAGGGGSGVPSAYPPGGDYSAYVGHVGTPGAPGANGTGGAAFGSIDASGYAPAPGTIGSPGSHGSGGGGGGGGGGGTTDCDSYGSSGGGGGSGGERGGAGGPGGGGGGSFGVLLQACDQITVQGCTILTGNGGAGGACGAGGLGGTAGTGGLGGPYGGGAEQDDGAFGAHGGDGGRGGDGGAGGGGGGGPTFGIANGGSSPVAVSGNSFTIGTPGPGGAGAAPGGLGSAGQVYGPSAILAVADPSSGGTVQLASAPNPFSSTTRIDYVLATESRVWLTVHDLQGARVATLADGVVPAGRYAVNWDGRVSTGGVAPTGVYFVRLTAGGVQSRLLKIVRTK